MKAIRLRCEQMENPLGIDVQKAMSFLDLSGWYSSDCL